MEKTLNMILLILKLVHLTNFLVAILKLKNGKMVFFLCLWKIKINVKRNMLKINIINSMFLMEILTLNGSNLLTQLWTTTRFLPWFLMIESLLLHPWDFYSKFLTSETPLQLLYLELVSSLSMSPISVGCLMLQHG